MSASFTEGLDCLTADERALVDWLLHLARTDRPAFDVAIAEFNRIVRSKQAAGGEA